MAPTFDSCIAPLTRDQFANDYLGKSVAYFPGSPDRFADLVSVDELNDVLSRLVIYPGMLRVLLQGHAVAKSHYLTDAISRHSDARLIKTAALETYLRSGATLIIDNCQGIFPAVAHLSASLAGGFASHVAATLFVVLSIDAPLPLHSDDHDVFVCQVIGQKRWPIYVPSSQPGVSPSSPSQAWEGVVNAGDVLYVPRDWPHQPTAVSAPSIHVTFDIASLTGADLLKFALLNVSQLERVRGNLRTPERGDNRHAYYATLREAVLGAMSDRAFDAFVTAQRLDAVPRKFSLPIEENAVRRPGLVRR
jgi:hypothetical protein